MTGLDFTLQTKGNICKKIAIFNAYMRCHRNKNGQEFLREYYNREQAFEYFIYLTKVRKYDDIHNYFNSTAYNQDYKMESSIGLFA